MEIYCAVLEKDCIPVYFNSKQKAFDYIWSNFSKTTSGLSEEELSLLKSALSTPDPDGYYEIKDFGYFERIVVL